MSHEIGTVTASRIILEKQCACEATSSGPRVVPVGLPRVVTVRGKTSGAYKFEFAHAEMACDSCDTPWRRV